ncbi:hypothetical protein HMI55_004868, partial [Coelomomyces lativittatus]
MSPTMHSLSSKPSSTSIHGPPKHATSSFLFPDHLKPQLQLWLDALFQTWKVFYENKKRAQFTSNFETTEAFLTSPGASGVGNKSHIDKRSSRRSFSITLDRRPPHIVDTMQSISENDPLNHSLFTTPKGFDPLSESFKLHSSMTATTSSVMPSLQQPSMNTLTVSSELEKFFSNPPLNTLTLESTVLQACIHLVAMMTPSLDLELRAQLSTSLLGLADCFENKNHPDAFQETLMYYSQTDTYMFMHLLFQEIASSFSTCSVAWVHGLTCLLDSTEMSSASVCLKAIQHLVHENQAHFEFLDLQTILYHCLFRLNEEQGGPCDYRTGILQVFSAWCPWIQKRIPEFTEKLIDTLFALPFKTIKETEIICNMFSVLAPSTPKFPWSILNQIQPEDGDRLDLVHWTAFHLCPDAPYPLLLDAHITSPHPTVRYGAALILTAYFLQHPDQLTQHAELITLGMCDVNSPVVILYRNLLKTTNTDLWKLVENNPAPMATFEKIAAGLHHVVSPHVQASWLNWMKLWSNSLKTFPPFVLQVMLSLLNSEKLKWSALKCLAGMSKVLSGMETGQIQLLWHVVEEHLVGFPELWVHFIKQNDFFLCLFRILLNGSFHDRYQTYQFLKENQVHEPKLCTLFWILALGDSNTKNALYVMGLLEDHHPILKPHLHNLKHQLNDPLKLIPEYDHFSQVLVDEGLLTEYNQAKYEPYLDFVWVSYFPGELSFPSPDDYSYQAMFRHSPVWLALVLHRMNVKPPPLNNSEGQEKRNEAPVNNAGNAMKRRFQLGFLSLLLPILGYPDSFNRVQACQALFLACFDHIKVSSSTSRFLIECLSITSTHKVWSYLASTLDIATLFLRAKVPLLSQVIVYQFFNLACEFAANNPFFPVRIAALHFLIACTCIFPLAMSAKYSEMIATLKPMLVDPDPGIHTNASLTWMIFSQKLSEINSLELSSMIRDTLVDISSGGPHLASDPFLQPLSLFERSRLIQVFIESLGHLNCPLEQITPICFGFLAHPLAQYREVSVKTLMRKLPKMGMLEKHVVLWICLPLCADPYPEVCEAANKDFLDPNFLFRIMPHAEDGTVLVNTPLDTLFTSPLTVPLQNRSEALTNFRLALVQYKFQKEARKLSREERLNQLPALAKSIGTVPRAYMDQVLYYYEKAVTLPALMLSGYRSMTLFAIEHDSALNSITRCLLQAAMRPCPEAMASLSYLCNQSVTGAHAAFEWLKETLTKGHDRIVELPLGAVQCFMELQRFVVELGRQEEWGSLFYHAVMDSTSASRGFAFEAKLALVKWLVDFIPQENVTGLLDILGWMVTRDSTVFALIHKLYRRFGGLIEHPVFNLLKKEVTSKAFDSNPSVRSQVVQLLPSLPITSPYLEILHADNDPQVSKNLNQLLTAIYPDHVENPMDAPQFLLNFVSQQEKCGSHESIEHIFSVLRNLTAAYPQAYELIPPVLQEYLYK